MPRISKSERIELWLDRLQRHSQTNQTIAQFCAVEGVSAPSFYQWKRRLETKLAERLETQIVCKRSWTYSPTWYSMDQAPLKIVSILSETSLIMPRLNERRIYCKLHCRY